MFVYGCYGRVYIYICIIYIYIYISRVDKIGISWEYMGLDTWFIDRIVKHNHKNIVGVADWLTTPSGI